jgi:CNT family concentrative nucleoside transporter
MRSHAYYSGRRYRRRPGGPADEALTDRVRLMMTYALCGFANFGGLTTMVPGRRSEIVHLSMKSLIAGTIANCMTGTLIGMLA